MGGVLNLFVSAAGCAQLEGAADDRGHVGIRIPAMDDVRGSVSAFTGIHRLADKPAGWDARHGAVGLHQVAQSSAGVGGEIVQEALVHPIDGSFEKSTV